VIGFTNPPICKALVARTAKQIVGVVSGKHLAKMFGVNPSQISRIQTGSRWSHVS
jgi:hypothetical protein